MAPLSEVSTPLVRSTCPSKGRRLGAHSNHQCCCCWKGAHLRVLNCVRRKHLDFSETQYVCTHCRPGGPGIFEPARRTISATAADACCSNMCRCRQPLQANKAVQRPGDSSNAAAWWLCSGSGSIVARYWLCSGPSPAVQCPGGSSNAASWWLHSA